MFAVNNIDNKLTEFYTLFINYFSFIAYLHDNHQKYHQTKCKHFWNLEGFKPGLFCPFSVRKWAIQRPVGILGKPNTPLSPKNREISSVQRPKNGKNWGLIIVIIDQLTITIIQDSNYSLSIIIFQLIRIECTHKNIIYHKSFEVPSAPRNIP